MNSSSSYSCCCFLNTSSFLPSSSSSSSSYFSNPSLLLRQLRLRQASSLTICSSFPQFQAEEQKKKKKISVAEKVSPLNRYEHLIVRARRRGKQIEEEEDKVEEEEEEEEEEVIEVKGSGTTARGRRLLKVREDKRKREHDRIHNYPAWAKILENACKDDTELRAVLGDSIGNPEKMRERVQERVRRKGRDFNKSKTGSILSFKVSFRDFNPLDSYIWFELYGSPSDKDVYLIGSVIQAWYVMGRLGAFNSSNLQLANKSMEYNPLYDADKGVNVLPSSFHDISDVEFQDSWGRVWVDLGTCDFFAIDVLLNCLTVLSSEYLGIQQVVFGGRCMGDWEEGMTSAEDGYKNFRI